MSAVMECETCGARFTGAYAILHETDGGRFIVVYDPGEEPHSDGEADRG